MNDVVRRILLVLLGVGIGVFITAAMLLSDPGLALVAIPVAFVVGILTMSSEQPRERAEKL